MVHSEQSPLAGQTVKLRDDFYHPQFPDCKELVIEDWYDRVAGRSWMVAQGNPGALVYAMRTGLQQAYRVPTDDEVLYGKYNGLGVLVHVSELAEQVAA
jgi:hypothetical protein